MALPPIHPLLVSFPAALIPVSLICDVAGRLFQRESLHAAGWWTLCFAAALTPLTALTGWLWLWSMGPTESRLMQIHQWLGTAVAVVLIPLSVWRLAAHRRRQPPGVAYLVVLGLVVAALVVQGDLGATMTFGVSEVGGHEHEHG